MEKITRKQKQVIFKCDPDLYQRAVYELPLHGQMSAYLRACLRYLVKCPKDAIRIIEEVATDGNV